MDLSKYQNCRAHKQWLFISNDEKTMRPCCYFKTNIEAENLADYREQLSKLDIKTNCENCISMEANGNRYTQRQELEDNLKDGDLKITVAFDNLCNMKCVYCSPRYSTQIDSENIKFSVYQNQREQAFYKTISVQTPKKIQFLKTVLLEEDYDTVQFDILGGEPLINPLIFEFLDWMAQQQFSNKIKLAILTNGTVYTEKILEYTKKFRHVSLAFSIDGTNETFEYIRFNGKYPQVKQNIDRYYKIKNEYYNFFLSFNYALTWMNCMNFAEWYNWISTDYPNICGIHMNKLVYPEHLSVDIIPIEQKKYIVNKVDREILKTSNSHIFIKAYEKYKTQMLTGDDNSHLYQTALDRLHVNDYRRGINHTNTFEEILTIMATGRTV